MDAEAYIPQSAEALAKQYLIASLPCHYDLCLAQARKEIKENEKKGNIPAILMKREV